MNKLTISSAAIALVLVASIAFAAPSAGNFDEMNELIAVFMTICIASLMVLNTGRAVSILSSRL